MADQDLSIDRLMAMSDQEFDEILDDGIALRRIALDERHVQVVLFHMLKKNFKAIETFSVASEKSSRTVNRLTWLVVLLMVVQILVAIL